MLIPRFTVRLLLLLTTLCGVFFYVVTLAIQGRLWAMGVSAAVGALALSFLVYAAVFGMAWMIASLFGVFRSRRVAASPFADSRPPPQYVQPPSPEE